MNDTSREKMRERLGNIDQIRELLFGDKIREDRERFEDCERRIEGLELELGQFQAEMRDRLTQLQSDLSTEINSAVNSLNKQVKYANLTTQKGMGTLKREFKTEIGRNSDSIDTLYGEIDTKTSSLQSELKQTRQALNDEVRALREQVFAELEQGFSNLKDARISRAELAEFLFELCFKVKGEEVPELVAAKEDLAQAEFALPEQERS